MQKNCRVVKTFLNFTHSGFLTHFARRLDAFDEWRSHQNGAEQQAEGQVPNHRPNLIQTTGPLESNVTDEEHTQL